jgi:hypothetical protein
MFSHHMISLPNNATILNGVSHKHLYLEKTPSHPQMFF